MQNRIACIDFDLTRSYRMYVVVPEDATDDETQDIAKPALCAMDAETFATKVILNDGADIELEDIEWMGVDKEFNKPTDLPVGTVTR